MSLLSQLRNAGHALDVQFQPASNEIQSILGALVHYAEHGDKFLEAAETGVDDVVKLLEPQPTAEQPATPGPAAPAAPSAPPAAAAAPAPAAPVSDTELENQIADLQAQLAARNATANQTVVDHETGGTTTAPDSPAPIWGPGLAPAPQTTPGNS